MLPLGDENPIRLTPIVNWSIIASCVLAFLWQTSGGDRFFIYTLFEYGLVPARVLSGEGLHAFVTNMFLHGGWTHLLGNMLFLWIFGDNIEDNIVCRSNSKLFGRIVFMVFYIICGLAASVLWLLTAWGSPYPAVGASGAIAGVLGAYFIFYPNRRIRTLVGFGFFMRIVRVRASVMIGFWFVYQFLMALSPYDAGVAWWAHIGGFIMGMVLAKILEPRPRLMKTYYSPGLNDWR